MTVATDITIIGAGPFGLSIAAYLHERHLDFRIFGSPMQSWLTKMPKGMLLKSEGFASTLYDPGQIFTLHRFCQDNGIPYQDVGLPVQLETFSSYGVAFQKQLVPDLEDDQVEALLRCPEGFELRMASGKVFKTHKVILAVGMDYFRHMPEPLAHLPKELATHSADHSDLERFRGQDVTVLGSGASAIDIAVLLHEARANVQLIVRKPQVNFGGEQPPSRPFLVRLREPMSSIGAGWRNRLFTDLPELYRYFPEYLRIRTAKRFLGPSGGWFMKERAALVPCLLGHTVQQASVSGSRVHLQLISASGSSRRVVTDHVIAATGYKSDVHRLPFLSPGIIKRLRLIAETPRLSTHFESSVPGLYFVGAITATTFGPVMRFAAGAGFTAQRISKHLATAASLPYSVSSNVNAIPGPQ